MKITITTKEKARSNREKDSGWGYACAHCIPVVPIYYAITRRTITPLIYLFSTGIVIGFSLSMLELEKNKQDGLANILSILATPLAAKIGISQIRDDKDFGIS